LTIVSSCKFKFHESHQVKNPHISRGDLVVKHKEFITSLRLLARAVALSPSTDIPSSPSSLVVVWLLPWLPRDSC